MQGEYYPPLINSTQFHCPYCNVFSRQQWGTMAHYVYGGSKILEKYRASICDHCHSIAIWIGNSLIVPDSSVAPKAHVDMPHTILEDYLEAGSIVTKSPRGAAALLRLVLQKLMVELGEEGKDINKDIGSLVSKGLPEEVQQALDIVRVIGNESVHPGTYDLRDNHETAVQLFELINFIIEERITRKKKIGFLYSKLPNNKIDGIEKRDKQKTT